MHRLLSIKEEKTFKNVLGHFFEEINSNNRSLNERKGEYESADTLTNKKIEEKNIPSHIIENEGRFMQNQTFRLWLTTKIQDGVIKVLGEK